MSESRHHHYLSQCYLKGFTKGNAKKSKLTVIDLKKKSKFETTPRNVGGVRDFNRVDIAGIDPEFFEKKQSEFESKVAVELKKSSETLDFTGETKDVILRLIGMLAIKSPEMREHLAKPQIQIAEKILSMAIQNEKRWNSQIEEFSEGKINYDDIRYEEMKDFIENKQYKITVSKEHQINVEITGGEYIYELLLNRNWSLVTTGAGAGEFITADNPVSLTWNYPDRVPKFLSPGFGHKDTMVLFPVNKNLALVGEYDRIEQSREANSFLIAMLNSKIIKNCYHRVFSSGYNFNYFAKGMIMSNAKSLLI